MTCEHVEAMAGVEPRVPGREECPATGGPWQLPNGRACGHVGRCDASCGRHATMRLASTAHPSIRSSGPGEDWFRSYVDELLLEGHAPPGPPRP